MKTLKKLSDSFLFSSNMDLWHMRFGHPSSSHLKLASLLFSFNISTHNNCNICPIAKQTRMPFSSSAINTQCLFDLLHWDITYANAQFFLTIFDDFTRCTWVVFIQHKLDTQRLLQSFIVEEELWWLQIYMDCLKVVFSLVVCILG